MMLVALSAKSAAKCDVGSPGFDFYRGDAENAEETLRLRGKRRSCEIPSCIICKSKGIPMQYVRLGQSGLRVSRLCLGCMSYGVPERGTHPWTLPEEQSRPFIQRA